MKSNYCKLFAVNKADWYEDVDVKRKSPHLHIFSYFMRMKQKKESVLFMH